MRSIHYYFHNCFKLYFIIFVIRRILSEVVNNKNCISSKYDENEIKLMKCKTISSGINICINEKGIYTYNSVLSNILYFYNFTNLKISINDLYSLAYTDITEFKTNDIKNNIILCFVNKIYLFILSYKGKFIFLSTFEDSLGTQSTFKFNLYNFNSINNEYKYIISYINGNNLNILYYSINKAQNSNDYINKKIYSLANSACSCEILTDSSNQHTLTCFGVIDNKFVVFSFFPEEEFKFEKKANLNIRQDEIQNLKNVKSSSYDKTKALVCPTTKDRSFCIVYNALDDSFSTSIFNLTGCDDKIYAINLYYFEKSEEFIFSCIGNQNYFKMASITKEFNYIEENDKFNYYTFEGCATPSLFSILFINPFQIYSIIINIQCTANSYPLRNYLLIENITSCDNIVNDINEGNYIKDEDINYEEEEEDPIIEPYQIIGTSKLTENSISSQNLESSIIKFSNEKTEFYQNSKLDEQIQPTQTDKFSENDIKSSQTINSEQFSEIETNKNINTNTIEQPTEIKNSQQIFNSDEKDSLSLSIKSDKILKTDENEITNQATDSKIVNSSQINDIDDMILSDKKTNSEKNIETDDTNDSITNSEYIDSTHLTEFTEKSESTQIDISNEITEYPSFFSDFSSTEKSIHTQVIDYSTDFKDSSKYTEEITDELSKNIPSTEINKINVSSNIIEPSETSSIEIQKRTEKAEITEIPGNTEKEKTDFTIKCDEKCSKCDEKSNNMNLCIECNKAKEYYELKPNKINIELNGEYKECYNKTNKPQNYFFNEIEEDFEPCYYTCGTCNKSGNPNEHNCLTCSNNYILDVNKISNCLAKCKYYFYYSNYGEYKCTIDNQCPEEASLLISESSKCTNSCQKENYYQYNGECVDKCPNGTEANENYICRVKEIEKCSYNLKDFPLNNEIQKNNIENIAKNYALEFSYTNNHISNYISNEYSIIIYKNSECIQRLHLDLPKIDFKECYQKVQASWSIEKDLIIGLIDEYSYKENNGVKNPVTTYAFFHPVTGENLNANKICEDIKIIVEEKISSILDDPKNVLFFSKQNVDILNISNEFYTDICFYFESPLQKDIVIKDRIQAFYPNVTLCDSGCRYKGLNFTSSTAVCECIFRDLLDKDLFDNFFFDNIYVSGIIDQLYESLRIINLNVMTCYKTIFNSKYISKCIGGFLIFFLFILEILCVIIYNTVGIKKAISFIFKVSEVFKNSNQFKFNKGQTEQTEEFALSPPKKKSFIAQDKNEASERTSCSINRKSLSKSKEIPQEKEYKHINRKMKKRKSKKEGKLMKNVNININMTNLKVTNVHSKNKSKSIMLMESDLLKGKKRVTRKFSRIPSNFIRINRKSRTSKNVSFFNNKSEKKEILEKSNMNRLTDNFDINFYLLTPIDEMDYDDAIQEEKKNFFKYFLERIKSQNLLINSFFITNNITHKSIKILLFLTYVDLYLLFNAMFYNEDYISEIFHNENESFYDIAKRSINHYIYVTFVGKIITGLMHIFFIKEKKYIRILKRAKNMTELNGELFLFTQKLRRGYKYFIIISICFTIFSWYYISCFNNVYQYTKKEWIITSFCYIFISLLLNAFATLLETIFRFLSFKIENDQVYKFSLFFRMFE